MILGHSGGDSPSLPSSADYSKIYLKPSFSLAGLKPLLSCTGTKVLLQDVLYKTTEGKYIVLRLLYDIVQFVSPCSYVVCVCVCVYYPPYSSLSLLTGMKIPLLSMDACSLIVPISKDWSNKNMVRQCVAIPYTVHVHVHDSAVYWQGAVF